MSNLGEFIIEPPAEKLADVISLLANIKTDLVNGVKIKFLDLQKACGSLIFLTYYRSSRDGGQFIRSITQWEAENYFKKWITRKNARERLINTIKLLIIFLYEFSGLKISFKMLDRARVHIYSDACTYPAIGAVIVKNNIVKAFTVIISSPPKWAAKLMHIGVLEVLASLITTIIFEKDLVNAASVDFVDNIGDIYNLNALDTQCQLTLAICVLIIRKKVELNMSSFFTYIHTLRNLGDPASRPDSLVKINKLKESFPNIIWTQVNESIIPWKEIEQEFKKLEDFSETIFFKKEKMNAKENSLNIIDYVLDNIFKRFRYKK